MSVRSCPHAAEISEPFSTRTVQLTPDLRSILSNSRTLFCDGRWKFPAVGFIGIKFTCEPFPSNRVASSFAICGESLIFSIRAYSKVTRLPVLLK
ncbi:MAG: hypothetical protein HW410_1471 [Nitrosarchaeum sp.]|nr:hypothetical protein [Nitrosarchaeum sp.]